MQVGFRNVLFALAAVAIFLGSAVHLQAQQDDASLAAKRQFVRTQMIREFADSLSGDLLAEIDRKVAGMSPERIEQLVETYQQREAAEHEAQSDEAYLQAVQDQATRDALIAQYQQRLAASRRGGNPGFAPVITTLPSGTQLGASAVVSPDRRYVRMNLQPFFSNVGPVQTFTFQNPTPFGQHRRVQVPFRPQ